MIGKLLNRWNQWLRKAIFDKMRPGRDEEELLQLIKRAEAIRSDEQRELLARMAEFHDIRIREIMIPRSAIKSIDAAMSIAEAEQAMVESGVTRLPVTEGDLDHILGFVHVWDLFAARVGDSGTTLARLIRPCLRVSELELVSGLLSDMREGSHIAIVLDEFGGTAGVVTLSDLLAEIVGSLGEGTETTDSGEYVRTESGALEVQARMHVEELEELLDCELPEGDFDTVGGLIITELGRIPVRGERVLVAGLDIHIQEADPRRIIKVLIKPAKKKKKSA